MQSSFRQQTTNMVGLCCGAIAVCLAVIFLNQRELGGYDIAAFTDVGWRMASGQMPYRDFPCLLPPLFYLLAEAAVRLFGNVWRAFALINCCVYLVLLASSWNAGRHATRSRRGVLAVTSFVALSVPVLVTTHLWHSTLSSMLASVLLLHTLVIVERCADGESMPLDLLVSASLVVGALCISKPNTAWIAIASLATFVVFVKPRKRLAGVLAASAGAGVGLALLTLLLLHISPVNVGRSYLTVSGRPRAKELVLQEIEPIRLILHSYKQPNQMASYERKEMEETAGEAVVAYVLIAIALGLTLVYVESRDCVERWKVPLLLSGMTISLIGYCTDWDLRFNDISPVLLAIVACSAARLRSGQGRVPNARNASILSGMVAGLCLALAVLMCLDRTRMKAVGPWAGPAYGLSETRNDNYLGHFYGREQLWKALQQMDTLRSAHPAASFFFGPRLEFEYARAGIQSPKGMPLWWHPGSTYAVRDASAIAQLWNQAAFDYVIMGSGEASGIARIPAGIANALKNEYDVVSDSGAALTVYQRKHAEGAASTSQPGER